MAAPYGDPLLSAPMPRFLQSAMVALGMPRPAAEPAAGALVPVPAAAGVGLPPPESPFWQRPDVAEKVLLAVAATERERGELAAQAAESLASERGLTREVAELKVGGLGRAVHRWLMLTPPARS